MLRVTGIFTLIPATLLLTLSFFVLFAADKAARERVRTFGRCVAGLLCASAALVLGMGLYILVTGHHPLVAIVAAVAKACQAQP
jgi:hypothetical protein